MLREGAHAAGGLNGGQTHPCARAPSSNADLRLWSPKERMAQCEEHYIGLEDGVYGRRLFKLRALSWVAVRQLQ
jgi:hypothetical protein